MDYNTSIKKMKDIQRSILKFLEVENDVEEYYQNLIGLIYNYDILNNRYDLKQLLYLILEISKNAYRGPNFLKKIEQILQEIKEPILKYFSNKEIFSIFQTSKAILLFVIQNSILIIDSEIVTQMKKIKFIKAKYHHFFWVEIFPFIEDLKKAIKEKQMRRSDYFLSINELNFKNIENYEQKRKNGENDNYICRLIQNDKIEDFIIFINKNEYSLSSNIPQSIFETNSFLLGKKPTLIEYATFFGSIQIFKYLFLNGVPLTSSLWLYAIHGDNPEIFYILEENHVKPDDISFHSCLEESIKCHNNDITNYIIDNYLDNNNESYNLVNNYNDNILSYSFRYHNYEFLPNDLENHFIFYYACQYDYFSIVFHFIKTKKIDLNQKII